MTATKTTVDGEEAEVVFDGTTGGPMTGEAPEALIDVPVTADTVLGNLARAMETEARLRTEANRAKNALTHAAKDTRKAAEFAAQWYNEAQQLGMNFAVGGTEPDDEDGGDGE